ncbi:BCCT family transporter [Jeotgalibacillus terrae]|uniref:BCCT family transporter n=1 Tax=Jeotgalibacillus terrae TaxID=587735 RepID=A0ABW5ZNL0_9BACL|nr:BCCT family transporter [Jeotgalibacillus terrae]MBM7581020.1 glycine betaine transporter [Jeotgalibacillus terrae]
MNPKKSPVFSISVGLAVAFVLVGVLFTDQLNAGLATAQSFMFETFGWYYQLLVTGMFLFAVYLAFGRFGKIKLGPQDGKPEFSRPVWFSMLFSAGIGIGLFFYGVSEPIGHFSSPPYGEGGTPADAVSGVAYTWLHWGFHAWAIYALVALALALQQFRYNTPGLMSSTLYSVLGSRVKGPIGHTVDIIAVFATLFGVAASLGLGAQQVNSGLVFLFDAPYNFTVQLIIMMIITVIFVISASTGIHKGIKYLSTINISISFIFLVFIFITGPTLFMLNMFVSGLAEYLSIFIPMSLQVNPVNEQASSWTEGWTIFYWAWWISWTPFVGMFIARISKGRTIREFIVGVILVPSFVMFIWFAFVGGTGIYYELYEGLEVSAQSLETALFYVLQELPFTAFMSFFTIIIVTIFFVTTADSATFVLGMQSTNGNLNPSTRIKITWGVLFVSITSILLLVGGLQAFQTAIVISALPLSFIVILMCVGLVKTLNKEVKGKKS